MESVSSPCVCVWSVLVLLSYYKDIHARIKLAAVMSVGGCFSIHVVAPKGSYNTHTHQRCYVLSFIKGVCFGYFFLILKEWHNVCSKAFNVSISTASLSSYLKMFLHPSLFLQTVKNKFFKFNLHFFEVMFDVVSLTGNALKLNLLYLTCWMSKITHGILYWKWIFFPFSMAPCQSNCLGL